MAISAGPFQDPGDVGICRGAGQEGRARARGLDRSIRMDDAGCDGKESNRDYSQFQDTSHWYHRCFENCRSGATPAPIRRRQTGGPEGSQSVRGFGGWDTGCPRRATPNNTARHWPLFPVFESLVVDFELPPE